MNKPKFYQAVLVPIEDVLEYVYKNKADLFTLTERMGSEKAECPECGKNKWWLQPKEGAAVREGGKPYIECLNCGYLTHL